MNKKDVKLADLSTEELVNVQGGGIGEGGCTPQYPQLPEEIQKQLDKILMNYFYD